MSKRKRLNSKFSAGSPAYLARQAKLTEIRKRMREGKSFSDLQGYDARRTRHVDASPRFAALCPLVA